MEDSFGGYYFDINKLEYSERLWEEFEDCNTKEYIGQINGKEFPLKYEFKKIKTFAYKSSKAILAEVGKKENNNIKESYTAKLLRSLKLLRSFKSYFVLS